MSTTTTLDLAEHVIATLRAHEAELRQAGIRRLSLFGSVARGDAEADSDVDLAAELDPQACIGLFALAALERRLADLVGGNRLRHAYDRISLDVIWNAARYDLPSLALDAQRVLAQLQAGDDPSRTTV